MLDTSILMMGKINKYISLAKHCFAAFLGTKQKRYESRHFILSSIAYRCGFRMYNPHLSWFNDSEALEIWKRFPESTDAVSERKFVLISAAKSIANIPGDTVECGVFRGASSFLILATQGQTTKLHHVFDSFEGLSEPSSHDTVDSGGIHYSWKKHDLTAARGVVERNLQSFGNVRYYPGWIPSRFPDVEVLRFSLVHIDVDLYEPTYDSLSFFYPRMTPGGLIICDDYGFRTCPGARAAFDTFFSDKPEGIVHLTTGQAIVFKQ